MKQSDLCLRSGVGYATLVAYEKGRTLPTSHRLARLCSVLGVEPSAIVPEDVTVRRFHLGTHTVQTGPSRSRSPRVRSSNDRAAARERAYRERIGDAIAAAREAVGLTVAQAAVLVGVSATNFYRWENGDRTPSAEPFARLCDVLPIDPATIGANPNPTKTRGRPVTTPQTQTIFTIRKGTIWRNGKGATVQVHEAARDGIVRYHRLPEGELLRLAVPVFLQRYAELQS